MSEIIFNQEFVLVDAGAPTVVEIPIPGGFGPRWTLITQPSNNVAVPNAVNRTIEGLVKGKATQIQAATVLNLNKANQLSQETDLWTRLRVTITVGATAPDEPLTVQLVGYRE